MVLSMTVAALLLTGGLDAQEKRGGVFGNYGNDYNEGLFNRNLGMFNVSFDFDELEEEDPTQDQAPLGSGLLILTATGVGYALLKKKEEKK